MLAAHGLEATQDLDEGDWVGGGGRGLAPDGVCQCGLGGWQGCRCKCHYQFSRMRVIMPESCLV